MITIAVLLTCFNRKEKTLKCLAQLYAAKEYCKERLDLTVFLTDDGSTDGTGEAVKKAHPEVQVLQGTGELFWAGGMRNSWSEAIKQDFDVYFLLNDDTVLYPNVFNEFIASSLISKATRAIYLGATEDPVSKKNTYGGAVLLNRFRFTFKHLDPNGSLQHCDLGNANIMFVTSAVVDEIGILSDDYIHGVADYDYTLRAVNKKIPVWLMPHTCGSCVHDHEDAYINFAHKSLAERKKYLNHPLGLDFKSNFNLMKNHFPLRAPLVYLSAHFKLLFPKTYLKLSNAR